jgi:adenylosuccinate synthase
MRLMADMGLPRVPATVWGTLRTYPIRVGNTPGGYSGDIYPDQNEIDWSDIGQAPEFTTVTGRQRRVFTFSRQQLEEAMFMTRPDKLFLNFCNYMDPTSLGGLVESIEEVADYFGSDLALAGYGPTFNDVKGFK